MQIHLSKMRPAMFNRRCPILLYDNAQHILPKCQNVTADTLDRKLCHIHHILSITRPLNTVFGSIWLFFKPKDIPLLQKGAETAFTDFFVFKR